MSSDVTPAAPNTPPWNEHPDLWHRDWDAPSQHSLAHFRERRAANESTQSYVILVNAGRSDSGAKRHSAVPSVPSRRLAEEVVRRLSYHCKVVERHPIDWERHIDASDREISAIEGLAVAIADAALARATETLRSEFASLSQQWKEDTAGDSVGTSILTHHAYQRIIAMGKPALPLILEDMTQQGGHWFAALRAITGEDPVAHEDRGRIRKMRAAWLDWGRRKEIIS